MALFSKFDEIRAGIAALQANGGRNPFDMRFDRILSATEALLEGRPCLLFGTNNYLGLTFDATCIEAARLLGENPYDIPFAAIYETDEDAEAQVPGGMHCRQPGNHERTRTVGADQQQTEENPKPGQRAGLFLEMIKTFALIVLHRRGPKRANNGSRY